MSEFIGKKAPNFKLENQKGEIKSLKDYSGKPLLIFFYPKDMTPGCTTEANGFNDLLKDFKKLGVEIVGVSKDDVAKHVKFCDKYDLKFDLLADIECKMVEDYGVWAEKSMFGKKYMGILRESFLIDKNGKVVKHYKKVKPAIHPEEVEKDAKDLL